MYTVWTFSVYFDVKKNSTKGDQVVLLKKYIAWHFDQHAKKNPEQMCVVLLDMSGASVTNVVGGVYNTALFQVLRNSMCQIWQIEVFLNFSR